MRPDFRNGQTFFFGQSVAREYLLVGETGAGSKWVGYGGEEAEAGELVWYEGRTDSRRSDVRMRKGLLDLVGVTGWLM